MEALVFNIVTPKGTYGPYQCDSIRLTLCDAAHGQGGGSCGIRKGHAKSLMTLDEGPIKGFFDGQVVVTGKTGCGFATVNENVVTAVVESFCKEEQ